MSAIRYRRVILGAVILAALAAAVNAHFILAAGTSVSHLTGDLSRLGIDISRNATSTVLEAVQLVTVLLCFVVGAAISGYVMHRPNVALQHPYGLGVIGVGALLLLAGCLESHLPLLAMGLAALACGMQNALASHYRGVIVRTTHVTGILTDLGQMLGMKARGHQVENWKWQMQAVVVVAFAVGAVVGAALDALWPQWLLGSAGVAYIIAGLYWRIRVYEEPHAPQNPYHNG